MKEAYQKNSVYKFKIDLIVWKLTTFGQFGAITCLFKIDLIVWKYRLFRETNDKLGCLK